MRLLWFIRYHTATLHDTINKLPSTAHRVDGDGAVTLANLAKLRQYLSKKIDSLK